jgi:hypothetical protein
VDDYNFQSRAFRLVNLPTSKKDVETASLESMMIQAKTKEIGGRTVAIDSTRHSRSLVKLHAHYILFL